MSEEKLPEAVIDFANDVEAACVKLKLAIGEQHGVGIKEETFTKLLGWQESQGNKIGPFEFTTRKANGNSGAFNQVYNILKVNNATINNRFHGDGYWFGYWLFSGKPDTIYKQKVKTS